MHTLAGHREEKCTSQRTQKYGHKTVHANTQTSKSLLCSSRLSPVANDPGKFVVPFLGPKSPRWNPLKVAVAVVSLSSRSSLFLCCNTHRHLVFGTRSSRHCVLLVYRLNECKKEAPISRTDQGSPKRLSFEKLGLSFPDSDRST